MNWIQHPVILESERIKLVPLESSHYDDILNLANDKRIWEFMTMDGGNKDVLLVHLKSVVLDRMKGDKYPFAIIDRITNNIIGITALHNLFPEHRKLEIGHTWYHPDYWATGYNTECKLLLLTFCFETLKTVRVQFQTSDKNIRSQKAIQKVGAKLEGVLRKERVKPDGTFRNSVMFSIIDEEWPEVKKMLHEKLQKTV